MSKTRKPRHVFAGTTRQTRLRIDEGLARHPDERRLRELDRSGQKLRDVINPRTGFCTGVTGPMESDGYTVRAAKPISGSGPALPEYDSTTGNWYVGEERLVVRTTDTPDGPLARTRLVRPDEEGYDSLPTVEKITRKPKIKAVRPAGDEGTRRHRRSGPRFTDEEILAFVRQTYGFRADKLTREIRTAAVAVMIKQATVAEYQADLTAARKKR
jgi:hypothetical protein